jgi:hypothetical protein
MCFRHEVFDFARRNFPYANIEVTSSPLSLLTPPNLPREPLFHTGWGRERKKCSNDCKYIQGFGYCPANEDPNSEKCDPITTRDKKFKL